MTMRLIALLLMLSPSLLWADPCDLILSKEFARPPDDSRRGFVTDRIPLVADALRHSYPLGIFPWVKGADGRHGWYNPDERGILFLNEVRIPSGNARDIRRMLRSGKYRVTVDQAFSEVIRLCAEVERADHGTWISPEHIAAYTEIFHAGQAHSIEVWEDDRLVGGLYFTFIGGYASGESMFRLKPNVTKLAYYDLIERLRTGGHAFLDLQVTTEGSLNTLGYQWNGRILSRKEVAPLLQFARAQNLPFLINGPN